MIDFELIYNKFNYGELLEVEKRLHQKLPADLRKFLIDRGTGYIKKWGEQDFLTYPDDSIDASIEYFCSTKEYLQYVGLGVENGYWPLMPPCSIPFAWGPGVDWGIYFKGPNSGKVFILAHDLGPEEEPVDWDIETGAGLPYEQYIIILQDSFGELMEKVKTAEYFD
ncbi:SMI1/KNR4 family protein [Corynebacterium uberis]